MAKPGMTIISRDKRRLFAAESLRDTFAPCSVAKMVCLYWACYMPIYSGHILTSVPDPPSNVCVKPVITLIEHHMTLPKMCLRTH